MSSGGVLGAGRVVPAAPGTSVRLEDKRSDDQVLSGAALHRWSLRTRAAHNALCGVRGCTDADATFQFAQSRAGSPGVRAVQPV